MRKLFMAAILSGLLASLPLMALPPAPAISVLQLFGTAGVTANTNSAIIDVSRMVNGAVQICSTDAPGATVVTVKVRMSSAYPWYSAAVLNGTVPLCASTTTVGYITMPLASQMQTEVSGYATGHILAAYGERAF
jgi:hypothetical protein